MTSLPFRILSVQTGTVCLACALSAALATTMDGVSMLVGALCIVLPSALYAWLARTEHRPAWVLALAGFKVVLSLLLLVVAVVAGWFSIGWLLVGIGAAYAAHLGATLWLARQGDFPGATGV